MEQLSQLPLFAGMDNGSCLHLLKCFQTSPRSFRAGEAAYTYGSGQGRVLGILQEGQAALVKIDAAGSRTVLERMAECVIAISQFLSVAYATYNTAAA